MTGRLLDGRYRIESGLARMHQGLDSARHEAVVHEEVLVRVERGVLTLEIAGAVAFNPMAEREVLGTRGRADRVGLHEPETIERLLQRARRKQGARHRVAAQIVEGHP